LARTSEIHPGSIYGSKLGEIVELGDQLKNLGREITETIKEISSISEKI